MNNLGRLQNLRRPFLVKLLILGVFGVGVCLSNPGVMPVSAQPKYARRPENVTFLIRAVGGEVVGDKQDERGAVRTNIMGPPPKRVLEEKPRFVFKTGEKIFIQTLIKNKSKETLNLSRFDWRYQYRFDLWQIGNEKRLLGVRSDQARLFSQRENNIGPVSFKSLPPLLPGNSMELSTIDLDDVYDKLEPGKYKLTAYYRGWYGALKLASSPLTIEIVP